MLNYDEPSVNRHKKRYQISADIVIAWDSNWLLCALQMVSLFLFLFQLLKRRYVVFNGTRTSCQLTCRDDIWSLKRSWVNTNHGWIFSIIIIYSLQNKLTVCKLNPDSEVGNIFNLSVERYWCHVTRPHTHSVSFAHIIKSVANLTVRIEFTYGITRSVSVQLYISYHIPKLSGIICCSSSFT